jgi:hypothetical protein
MDLGGFGWITTFHIGCNVYSNTLFMQASTELAATYAALILADDGIEITVRRTMPARHFFQRFNHSSSSLTKLSL